MKKLIGISGKAQSGKDTVAAMLCFIEYDKQKQIIKPNRIYFDEEFKLMMEMAVKAQYYTRPEIIRFADTVKDIACMLIGCTRAELENSEFKNKPLGQEWNNSHGITTPRELLQIIGTECGRNTIHPDVWIIATINKMKLYRSEKTTFIIPDVRFPNEKQFVEENNGIIIRVENNRIQEVNHESETALDNELFDYTIFNNGSLHDLYLRVKSMYEEIEMY